MIDFENANSMDYEAIPGFQSAEVESTDALLERAEIKYRITPKSLLDDRG